MNYLLIITFIALLMGVIAIFIYNTLAGNKNRMQKAWDVIEICLKKRHDLISNLVETVEKDVVHEKQILEEITRYHSDVLQAKNQESRIQSESELEKALGRLLAVAGDHPDLKANTHFLELQQQLTDVEDELVLARRYYNATVRENNIYLESFPSNLIAGFFHFSKGGFFAIASPEKETF